MDRNHAPAWAYGAQQAKRPGANNLAPQVPVKQRADVRQMRRHACPYAAQKSPAKLSTGPLIRRASGPVLNLESENCLPVRTARAPDTPPTPYPDRVLMFRHPFPENLLILTGNVG